MDRELLMTDTIVFDAKPDAVPFNYRISYKMGILAGSRHRTFDSRVESTGLLS